PAAGITVMNNTFGTNDVGIYNLAKGATLMGNTLTQNRFHSIILDQGDATVDTNTVSGPVVMGCGSTLAGITVLPDATATIQNNMILDVRHDPLDGCQEGNGIVVGTAPDGAATATITHNTIARYQKTGIVVKGTGSMSTITGNTVTGAGLQMVIAQNGIQV